MVKDSHPLPRTDSLLEALLGAKYFSTLDHKSGYYQVELDPKDRPKTAFSFPGGGLWQFTVLGMGLTTSPAVFERLMESVLAGLCWLNCLVYLDDIIVISDTFEKHVENLTSVLQRMRHFFNLIGA